MSYGYSARTIAMNKAADHRRLGVALGRAAILLGVSVSEVARTMGVSRQTVYNWFIGNYDPQAKHISNIKTAIAFIDVCGTEVLYTEPWS